MRWLLLMAIMSMHASCERVVVTFETWDLAAQSVDSVGAQETIVKQYGRRLVLELGPNTTATDLQFSGVVSVEEDVVITLSEDAMVFTQSAPTQWNLEGPYGLDLTNVTSRGAGVVAVLDTGLSGPGHSIIETVLPGYDFITDTTISLDGNGRDADPTDPGDAGPGCPSPSWHGTKVASIIASNRTDMQGVAPGARLLPVRVLGQCGSGYASDITDAIVWSAGGNITGVGANQNPARVISMSFAGLRSCPSYLQSGINQAVGLGAVLLAAAGNSADLASKYFPGNCAGVIDVAASTRLGALAPYSNFGPPVAYSAPGGDSNDPIRTLDGNLVIKYVTGTSFSVPHVAGLAALGVQKIRALDLRMFLNTSVITGIVNTNKLSELVGIQALYGPGLCAGGRDDYNNAVCYYDARWISFGGPTFSTLRACLQTVTQLTCNFPYYYTSCAAYGAATAVCASCASCSPANGLYTAGCSEVAPGSCAACTVCQPGQIITSACITSADATCQSCTAGTYSASTNSPTCSTCSVCSSIQVTTAACTLSSNTVCTTCQAGYYIASSTTCTICPAGYYSSAVGSTSCTICPAGTAAAAGSTSCTPCTLDYSYSTASASGTCSLCSAAGTGQYNNCTLTSNALLSCPPLNGAYFSATTPASGITYNRCLDYTCDSGLVAATSVRSACTSPGCLPPLPPTATYTFSSAHPSCSNNATLASADSWCPLTFAGSWTMIDLGAPRALDYIATRGRGIDFAFMTAYTLQYGNDTTTPNSYSTVGFRFNVDNTGYAINRVSFTARYIKLSPTAAGGSGPALRWAMFPVEDGICTSPGCIPIPQPTAVYSFSSTHPACNNIATLNSADSWCPLTFAGSWTMMDLGAPMALGYIVTRGRKIDYAWISGYTLQYGNYTNVTSSYSTVGFNFNHDNNGYAINRFTAPIVARYIKLFPTTSSAPAMRWAVFTVDNGACATCSGESFVVGGSCRPPRTCGPGTTVFRTTAGAPILDAGGDNQCTACVPCPPGSFQFQACTPTSQTVCSRCSADSVTGDQMYPYNGACVSTTPTGYKPASMLVSGSVLAGFTNNSQAFPIWDYDGSVYTSLAWSANGLYLSLYVPCRCP